MAITQPSKRSKTAAFEEAAPDAKSAPKLRGKLRVLTFGLPPDLVDKIDAIAAEERRSRARMIEVLLLQSIEARLGRQEAA